MNNVYIDCFAGSAVYRCTLLIQEPYSSSLADRESDDFQALSDRFQSAVESLYDGVPGDQTATIQTFQYVIIIIISGSYLFKTIW